MNFYRKPPRTADASKAAGCTALLSYWLSKGQWPDMFFWPIHFLLVWTESIWKFFEFGLLLTEVGREFAHLTLYQNKENGYPEHLQGKLVPD
jgi:hypothetical protein